MTECSIGACATRFGRIALEPEVLNPGLDIREQCPPHQHPIPTH
jgi:hypothetical protein